MLNRYFLSLIILIFCSNLSSQIYYTDSVAFPRKGVKSLRIEVVDTSKATIELLSSSSYDYDEEGRLIKFENSYGNKIDYTYSDHIAHVGEGDFGECQATQYVERDSLTVTIYEREEEGQYSCHSSAEMDQEMNCKYGLYPEVPRVIPNDDSYSKITVLTMHPDIEHLVLRRLVYYKRENGAVLWSLEDAQEFTTGLFKYQRFDVRGDCLHRSWSSTRNEYGRFRPGRTELTYKYDDKGNWIEERSNYNQKITKRIFTFY